MTEKELLYLEDAISHEQSIIDILNNTNNDNINDFFNEEVKKHENTLKKLLNKMETKSNE